MRYLTAPLKSIFLFASIIVISVTYADASDKENNFIETLVAQQQLYNHCVRVYPKEMQRLYGQNTSYSSAIQIMDGFDEGARKQFPEILNTKAAQSKELVNKVAKKIGEELKDNETACNIFLLKKYAANIAVDKIFYDKQSLNFFLRINKQWFSASIDGYGLDCACSESDMVPDRKKLLDFIEKSRRFILKGDEFSLEHSNYEPYKMYLMHSMGKHHQHLTLPMPANLSVIEQYEFKSEHTLKDDDLGLEFKNLEPIVDPTDNKNFEVFLNTDMPVYYNCKVNYRNNEESTCLAQLISLNAIN